MALVEIESKREQGGSRFGRTRHSREWRDDVTGAYRRRIQNGSCWETPSGILSPVDPGIPIQESEPPEWGGGTYDFVRWSRFGLLQIGVGRRGDTGVPFWGVQPSYAPQTWLTFRLHRVGELGGGMAATNDSTPVPDASAKTVTWPDIDGAGASLELQVGRKSARKRISYQPGAARRFEFTLHLPDDCTLDVSDGSIRVLRAGVAEIETRPVWAADNGGSVVGEPVAATLTRIADVTVGQRTFPRVALDVEDTTGRIGPIVVDPTATVTGTSDTEDNMMRKSASAQTYNYGATGNWYVGTIVTTDYRRVLLRIATGAIPSGTISGFRLGFYRFAHASSQNGDTMYIHPIVDGNVWVEGTASNVAQTGSSCWSRRIYSTTQWLGSLGCSTSATDYDSTAMGSWTYSGYTSGPDVNQEIDLTPSIATAWRDATRENNGMIAFAAESNNNMMIAYSSEDATYPIYFEIDYSDVSGGPVYYRKMFGMQ